MSSSVYTCITCHVAFADAEIQRSHYKTDWHRYNLKRKVVALPPVSAENFHEKITAQQAIAASNKSQENIVGVACKVCQRKFNSFNSFNNHLKSKKHRDAEQKQLESVRSKLEESKQAHPDKRVHEQMDEILEKNAVHKALGEAKQNLQQPTILRSDDTKTVEKRFAKGDNPRLRWYKKQVKEMKVNEKETSEGSDEEWEELSDDDDETVGDQSDSEVESQTESTATDASLAGVMSRVKLDSDADIESLASEVGPNQRLLGIKDCLFCSKKVSDVESNVSHMSRVHGFFIPELPYLTDLEGLLTYLGEKVGVGNVCLWCNERGHAFYSLRAVRTHMKDKGHCKVLTDGDAALEYADFYDFSPSYPDYDPDAPTSSDDDDMSVVPVGDVLRESTDEDMELVLPSGAKIGHRSLMRYYKQNFPPIERFNQRTGRKRIDRLMAQYKAIGWHGTTGTSVMKRHDRDMKFLQTMKSKYQQKLGHNNNKTMMKHFRNQIGF